MSRAYRISRNKTFIYSA